MDGAHLEGPPAEGQVYVETVDEVTVPEAAQAGQDPADTVALGQHQWLHPGREFAPAPRTDGGGDVGVDHGYEGGQQLVDVRAHPTAPGVERQGVDDEARPTGHVTPRAARFTRG